MESKTILVVDDDAQLSGFVMACLEQAGFRVLLAGDGEAAMLLYQEYRATIQMLLIDVMMPTISGFEFADQILKQEPETPILFMSGSCLDATRGYGCLSKPFCATELIGRVGDVLNRKGDVPDIGRVPTCTLTDANDPGFQLH